MVFPLTQLYPAQYGRYYSPVVTVHLLLLLYSGYKPYFKYELYYSAIYLLYLFDIYNVAFYSTNIITLRCNSCPINLNYVNFL